MSDTHFQATGEARTKSIDEAALLLAAGEGDRNAAGQLVDSTYTAVFKQLYRLSGDRETAADLTQETYRRAWAGLASFNGKAKFSTWLYRVAYTTFLNSIRGPRRLVPLEEQHLRTVSDPARTVEETVAQSQAAERLRRAVLDLPDPQREVVVARYWAEVSVREIARLEGITEPAVRKRLKRALAILEEALEVPS
jgi:RNA polymerase sigma-70 factor (ECF subfamily)